MPVDEHEEIRRYCRDNDRRVEELEKKLDLLIDDTMELVPKLNTYFERIESLEKDFKHCIEWIDGNGDEVVMNIQQISELKDELKKINILYFDKDSSFCYKQFYNRVHSVLRESFLSIIHYFNSEEEDDIKAIETMTNFIEKQLKKLDGEKDWTPLGGDRGFTPTHEQTSSPNSKPSDPLVHKTECLFCHAKFFCEIKGLKADLIKWKKEFQKSGNPIWEEMEKYLREKEDADEL